MSSTLTYKTVAEHKSKKDLYIVVHDKVYNASNFVDEHPYVKSTLAMNTHLLSNSSEHPALFTPSSEPNNIYEFPRQQRPKDV